MESGSMDNTICRICLLTDNQLVNLFDNSVCINLIPSPFLTYFDKLMVCVPWMNVSKNDPYPHRICPKCCQLLNRAYEFHQICIESERKFGNGSLFIKIEPTVAPEQETISGSEVVRQTNEIKQNCRKSSRTIKKRTITPGNKMKKVKDKSMVGTPVKKIRKNAARYDENGRDIIKKRRPKVQCDICNNWLVGKFNLVQHMRIHSGERPFVCEVCGKAFSTRGSVKMHLDSHNKSRFKRLKCNLCSFKSDRLSNFKRHVIIHTGECPYECYVCGRKFNSQVNLSTHIKKMHSEPSFKCNLCDKRFRTICLLRRHITLHYLPVHFLCPVCKDVSGEYRGLIAHMKRHHSGIECPTRKASCITNTERILE